MIGAEYLLLPSRLCEKNRPHSALPGRNQSSTQACDQPYGACCSITFFDLCCWANEARLPSMDRIKNLV